MTFPVSPADGDSYTSAKGTTYTFDAVSGGWIITGTTGRKAASAAINFYVDTGGSDILGDGTNAKPWRTIQYATKQVTTRYDFAGNIPNVYLGAGTFAEEVYCSVAPLSVYDGRVNYIGAGRSSTIVDAYSLGVGSCFKAGFGSTISVSTMTLKGYTACLFALYGGSVFFDNLDVEGGTNGQIIADGMARAISTGGTTRFYGTARNALRANSNSIITIDNSAVEFMSPSYTYATVESSDNSNIRFIPTGLSGSASGTRSYANGGNINVGGNGANYIPGTGGDVQVNGGQYY